MTRKTISLSLFAFAILALVSPGDDVSAGEPAGGSTNGSVHFVNDVMPLLSKLGCNVAKCHGSVKGKGGFKLSMFGSELGEDYAAFTKSAEGRRVNKVEPDKSLFLLKATASIPHEGAKTAQLQVGSAECNMLAAWVAQGALWGDEQAPKLVSIQIAPEEQILQKGEAHQIAAVATFSDGSRKDVTRHAHYASSDEKVAAVDGNGKVQAGDSGESHVLISYMRQNDTLRIIVPQPLPSPFPNVAPNNKIDEFVFAKLRKLGIPPSELCSDQEFLRRVYLDLLGLLPTPDEARAYLADSDPQKRSKLVDRLLERDEDFADFWALKWADLLRIKSGVGVLRPAAGEIYYRWIHDRVARNTPYDRFVRELLTASGSNYRVGAANFFLPVSNRDPQSYAESAALVFMGARLSCARCHVHPVENWTLDDGLGLGAFFATMQVKATKEWTEEIVFSNPKQTLRHPKTGQVVAPKFLGGEVLDLAAAENIARAAEAVAAAARSAAAQSVAAHAKAAGDAAAKRQQANEAKKRLDDLVQTQQTPAAAALAAATQAMTDAATAKAAADKALADANAVTPPAQAAQQAAEKAALEAEAAVGSVAVAEERMKKAADDAAAKRKAADEAMAALSQAQANQQQTQAQADTSATKLAESEAQRKTAEQALAGVTTQVAAATTAYQTAEKAATDAEAMAAAAASAAATSAATQATTANDAAAKRQQAHEAKKKLDDLVETQQKPAAAALAAATQVVTDTATAKAAVDKALADATAVTATAQEAQQAAEKAALEAEADAKAIAEDATKSEEEKKQAADEAAAKRKAADEAMAALSQAQESQRQAQAQADAGATKLAESEAQRKAAEEALAAVTTQVAAATTAQQAAEKAATDAEAVAAAAAAAATQSATIQATTAADAAAKRQPANEAKKKLDDLVETQQKPAAAKLAIATKVMTDAATAKAAADKTLADAAAATPKAQEARQAAEKAALEAEAAAGSAADAAAKAIAADAAKSEEEKKKAADEATAKRQVANEAMTVLSQAQERRQQAQAQADTAAKKLAESEAQRKTAEQALADLKTQVAAATTARQAAEKAATDAEAAAATAKPEADKAQAAQVAADKDAAEKRVLANKKKQEDPREAFADWLTSPENPWFARNIANRVWFWLLGRGIVHEVDDLRNTNLPENPDLLKYLEQELVANKYDLKHIYRLILNSRTYQLSSRPNQWNEKDLAHFSHYRVKRLGAEQLLDAISGVTETWEMFYNWTAAPVVSLPMGHKATRIADGSTASAFLDMFGRAGRNTSFESQRSSDPSVQQSLYLVNSDQFQAKVANSPRMKRLFEAKKSDAEMIDDLYFAALSRAPREEERNRALDYVLGTSKPALEQAAAEKKAAEEALAAAQGGLATATAGYEAAEKAAKEAEATAQAVSADAAQPDEEKKKTQDEAAAKRTAANEAKTALDKLTADVTAAGAALTQANQKLDAANAARQPLRVPALQDIFWALLNTREFMFNH